MQDNQYGIKLIQTIKVITRDNAHETRDSISLISYAGCLGLSPVYFCENSLNVRHSLKIAKNSLKTHIFGVQGHRCWYPGKLVSLQWHAYHVMIRSKSVSICNHSSARLVDSSRNRTFSRGYPNLMRSYGGLLEPRRSNLTPLKSTFNAQHSCLSWMVSAQFSLKMCTAA